MYEKRVLGVYKQRGCFCWHYVNNGDQLVVIRKLMSTTSVDISFLITTSWSPLFYIISTQTVSFSRYYEVNINTPYCVDINFLITTKIFFGFHYKNNGNQKPLPKWVRYADKNVLYKFSYYNGSASRTRMLYASFFYRKGSASRTKTLYSVFEMKCCMHFGKKSFIQMGPLRGRNRV